MGTGPLSSWASASQAALVVDWACLTQGIGCPAMRALQPPAAEDAPGAPANLAFQVSGNTVILTWSPPGSGGAVAAYILEAGSAAGQSNILIFNTGSAATTLTATGVPSATYFVRVRAQNADGTSGPSNEAVITVGSPCPTPGAPTGLTASTIGNTVTLTWNAVAEALAFIIEAGSAPGLANLATLDTGNAATSFTATAPDGTYYVRVRARTSCGISAASNEAVLTVGAPPPTGGVAGRWIGLVANGDGLNSEGETFDWTLDLTQSGNSVTGTLTQRDVNPCRDAPNCRVQTAPLTGTVSGANFSFVADVGRGRSLVGNATFTSTRMTGNATGPNGERGTFALNRQ
jgi:hypothetical protein